MKLQPFVDFKTYNATNPFGQYDKTYYPLTGHHIGSDFKVPQGTPITAPCDGDVIKAISTPARGNTAVFDFVWEGEEWGLELCHLKLLPKLGKFKTGDIIAISGNTGSATTGAHLHAVMHRDAMVTKNYTELISEEAYLKLWREGRIADTYYWFWQRM